MSTQLEKLIKKYKFKIRCLDMEIEKYQKIANKKRKVMSLLNEKDECIATYNRLKDMLNY